MAIVAVNALINNESHKYAKKEFNDQQTEQRFNLLCEHIFKSIAECDYDDECFYQTHANGILTLNHDSCHGEPLNATDEWCKDNGIHVICGNGNDYLNETIIKGEVIDFIIKEGLKHKDFKENWVGSASISTNIFIEEYGEHNYLLHWVRYPYNLPKIGSEGYEYKYDKETLIWKKNM